jgi:hypothetical protein
MGYANSGLLTNGKAWSLTFTHLGTYKSVAVAELERAVATSAHVARLLLG